MHELNTNQRLAPITVQFVPLKVITEGGPWGTWARKYPPKGDEIPYLYVIRADGEMLYGESGTKSGDELGRFMVEHLRKAGRLFSDRELAYLQSAVEAAKEAMAQGETGTAAQRIGSLSKLGTIGDLGSYSTIAKQADDLGKQLIDEGTAAVEQAIESLNTNAAAFEGALALAEAESQYGALPEVDMKIRAAYRKAGKDADRRLVLEQAEAIQKARARLKLRDGTQRAVRDLNRVIEKFPNSKAADEAVRQIAEITGQPVAGQPPAGGPADAEAAFRTWSDATGTHQIEARLVATQDGWVQLETRDGKTVELPISKLSSADQQFLNP